HRSRLSPGLAVRSPARRSRAMPSAPNGFKQMLDERTWNLGSEALPRVDQNELGVVVSSNFDLALAGNCDAVTRVHLDPIHAHPAAGNQIEVPLRVGVDRNCVATLHRRSEHPCISVDGQCAILGIAAGEELECALAG